MFEKILIANRGEITCRVIKTARKLGIKTVVVYSDADANSQAVQQADEAYYIGAAPSSESYLKADKILEIAKLSGAQAVHPGYGFLSENAHFARACEEAGIAFIGPPASAIEVMGSKSAAKRIMEESNVPVTPGYHGDDQHPEKLLSEACRIGFPVLIKAAAGGGGKGMRAVFSEAEFSDALAGAKREALASFGDDVMLIEKYLVEPRHIEIQVFCDQHGNAVYLFERDCSIQRRHQKIIEEAPAPHFKPALREAMGNAAVQAAKTIGYVGAGTIEFLLDQDEKFYFMEMNTRLQVEHPVTEMITQQDLVEWQLRVACKEPLPLKQKDLHIHGHAIETRIYAEDPDNLFLPSIGQLIYLKTPAENQYVRIDTGVTQGDSITPYYDPMMAKLIVYGENREAAIRRLEQALAEYYVIGVKNNIAFLKKVIQQSDFQKGILSTRFIEKHHDALSISTESDPQHYLMLACLYEATEAACSNDPWDQKDSWQMNLIPRQNFTFNVNNATQKITLEHHKNTIKIQENIVTHYRREPGYIRAKINDDYFEANIFKHADHLYLLTHKGIFTFSYYSPESLSSKDDHGQQQLTAPMPGAVVALHVKVGDKVKAGQALIVLEAMKMEHTLSAPYAGKIKEIYFSVGNQVADGSELMEIEKE